MRNMTPSKFIETHQAELELILRAAIETAAERRQEVLKRPMLGPASTDFQQVNNTIAGLTQICYDLSNVKVRKS